MLLRYYGFGIDSLYKVGMVSATLPDPIWIRVDDPVPRPSMHPSPADSLELVVVLQVMAWSQFGVAFSGDGMYRRQARDPLDCGSVLGFVHPRISIDLGRWSGSTRPALVSGLSYQDRHAPMGLYLSRLLVVTFPVTTWVPIDEEIPAIADV
ncbi:hypothetical protein Dsin_017324 [Dipteronia sinensis]|uniref:Uncharacterized protein n=1 Tax=Dipteronia sinensis TaxID=43782 RepID=A0AAE0E7S7_9ROSI|nr:hypothetical protein Dsin_017324 [Dipteronia sinensis]